MRKCAIETTQLFNHNKLHQRSEQHMQTCEQLCRIASLRLCQTMSLNNIVLPHFLILD